MIGHRKQYFSPDQVSKLEEWLRAPGAEIALSVAKSESAALAVETADYALNQEDMSKLSELRKQWRRVAGFIETIEQYRAQSEFHFVHLEPSHAFGDIELLSK